MARRKRESPDLAHEHRSAASPTRGWRKDAPHILDDRRTLAKRCGAERTFLDPEHLKYPVAPKCAGHGSGARCTCKPDCRGVAAAFNRSRQYHNEAVAKRALELGRKLGCAWAEHHESLGAVLQIHPEERANPDAPQRVPGDADYFAGPDLTELKLFMRQHYYTFDVLGQTASGLWIGEGRKMHRFRGQHARHADAPEWEQEERG